MINILAMFNKVNTLQREALSQCFLSCRWMHKHLQYQFLSFKSLVSVLLGNWMKASLCLQPYIINSSRLLQLFCPSCFTLTRFHSILICLLSNSFFPVHRVSFRLDSINNVGEVRDTWKRSRHHQCQSGYIEIPC